MNPNPILSKNANCRLRTENGPFLINELLDINHSRPTKTSIGRMISMIDMKAKIQVLESEFPRIDKIFSRIATKCHIFRIGITIDIELRKK